MREAKVTCLCNSYIINDIGRTVRKGEFFWILEEEVLKSKDLSLAQQVGAVKVSWEKRCRTLRNPAPKPPPPPFVAKHKPPLRTSHDSDQPTIVVNTDYLRQVFAEEFSRFRLDLMGELVKLMTQVQLTLSQTTTSVDVEEAVSKALQSIPYLPSTAPTSAPSSRSTGYDTGTEIFIPSNIVPLDGKAEIEIESSEEEGNLDDALAALRQLKNK